MERKLLIKNLQKLADSKSVTIVSPDKEMIRGMKSATGFLARRNHTEYEIRCKLLQKNFKKDVISKVISRCIELNYIDDAKTAGFYINELKAKGYGQCKIQDLLNKKRVPVEIIDKFLYSHFSEEEEIKNAFIVLQKRGKKFNRELNLKKRKEKMYRFLCSRGFTTSVIFEVLRRW